MIFPARSPGALLDELRAGGQLAYEHLYELGAGHQLAVALCKGEPHDEVLLATDLAGPLTLHWGVVHGGSRGWVLPPEALRPQGSSVMREEAIRTPFAIRDGLLQLRLPLRGAPIARLCFVLHEERSGTWWKNQHDDFSLPLSLRGAEEAVFSEPGVDALAHEIIERETGAQSWALMHRFQLCHDLLERVPAGSSEAHALLFVWLRYSSIRQLDWQRRYNTKPRELSHAQERLSRRIAQRAARAGGARRSLRMMAGTVGRGGEGQQVRDEILAIMHRHAIRELSGQFLEEWHQKLHNNTTADDIAICEAYLEFLQSYGDEERFYARLAAGGVSRERLASFERPITTPPDFIPHLRDALLYDFSQFLRTLKEVHAATDLETAIAAAVPLLAPQEQQLVEEVWRDHESPAATELVQEVSALRKLLHPRLAQEQPGLRDLLYLDLALEDFLRLTIERGAHAEAGVARLLSWSVAALENLLLTRRSEELELCARHFGRLARQAERTASWALHVQAVIERTRREIAAQADADYARLQPIAQYLGRAFGADSWAIDLFGEEVVRGMLDSAAAGLLRRLNELLRRTAGLGDWDIASRGRGACGGQVVVVRTLKAAQGRRFDTPTVLVAERVEGEEEIPEGVSAVLTPSTVDLMSHLAVRARNAGVLCATCYNPELLERLRDNAQRMVRIQTNGAELLFNAGRQRYGARPPPPRRIPLGASLPFDSYAITEEAFAPGLVGAKALSLKALDGRLPDWILRPQSIGLPFGVLGHVLADRRNARAQRSLAALAERVATDPVEQTAVVLEAMRALVLQLVPPSSLEEALRGAMQRARMPWPDDWPAAWGCIARVWASKWNERAYLSRRAHGIPHDELAIAVLIQELVEAQYSFVIHTVDPTGGDHGTLYAELVLGLGETLVGNYPGRALGFRCRKDGGTPELTSFPSKSTALCGGGVIFRSDSNGEDLEGYAGAGLYDSIPLPTPRPELIDYERERLLWEPEAATELLTRITAVGAAVEAALGAPQDVEGVVSKGRIYVVQCRPQVGLMHG